jgi:Tfp pilus assembly protein PilN
MLNAPDPLEQGDPLLEQQPAQSGSLSRIILWLIVLCLSIAFVSLFLIASAIQKENIALSSELAEQEITLSATPIIPEDEQTARGSLLTVQQQANSLETLHNDLDEAYINLPDVMLSLSDYDLTRMRLTGMTQVGYQITLTGQAINEQVITAYLEQLRASDYFEVVEIHSITRRDLEENKRNQTTPAVQVAEFTITGQLTAGNSSDGSIE